MKEVIGIVNPVLQEFDESSLAKGVGGSETWAIELSKCFVKLGYHVIQFCLCRDWHISQSGVEYVPIKLFEARCQYQHFDYMIVSRAVNFVLYDNDSNPYVYDISKIISSSKCCDNVYLMAHDIYIMDSTEQRKIYISRRNYDIFDKVVCLSETAQQAIKEYNRFPAEKLVGIIPNGINLNDFNDLYTGQRDNVLLWSSRPERGMDILLKELCPEIRKEVRDFEVHVCSYDVVKESEYNFPNVKFLGKLNKHDLYDEMSHHKTWFYPGVFNETFCISAIENVMCNCDIVAPLTYGLATTFKYFSPIGMKYEFEGYYQKQRTQNYKNAFEEAKDRIIRSFKEYDDPKSDMIRQILKKYISCNYSWEEVAKKWQNLFNTTKK